MNVKGRIRPDYYISCGRCRDGRYVGESVRARAVRAARQLGYIRTRKEGWVCSRCQDERETARRLRRERVHADE